MKFIWFDVCASYEDIEKMIEDKNLNCSESLCDILYRILCDYDDLFLNDLIIKPHFYDLRFDSQMFVVLCNKSEESKVLGYFIQV